MRNFCAGGAPKRLTLTLTMQFCQVILRVVVVVVGAVVVVVGAVVFVVAAVI